MIFLKKTFVVLIAVLLLISTSGIFVMIHTCIGSKKTEISFSDEHKCCNNKKKNKKVRVYFSIPVPGLLAGMRHVEMKRMKILAFLNRQISFEYMQEN